MWYLKEAVKKVGEVSGSVYTYSKGLVGATEKASSVSEMIDELVKFEGQILPTSKMEELVKLSYDIDSFEQISEDMFERLKIFKYSSQGIRKAHNMLVLVSYLIKHGVSGFIDDFRNSMIIFKNYQKLHKEKLFPDDNKKQKDVEDNIDTIKSKARHIEILLTDKAKLLKEKELAMLVKQKLRLYEQSKSNKLKEGSNSTKAQPKALEKTSSASSKQEESKKQNRLDRLNDLMEKYLWTYVDKVDDTVSNYSQKVLNKLDHFIDKVVEGDVKPEAFEFQDDIQIGKADIQEAPREIDSYQALCQIQNDIQKIQVKNQDLLDFESTNSQFKGTDQTDTQTKGDNPKGDSTTIDLLG